MAEARVGPDPEADPEPGRVRTAPDEVPVSRVRRGRAIRRAFFVALCLLLAAAATGLLGVRSAEVRAEGGGYELLVTYPSIIRPGLAAPWSVEVRHPGGFSRLVTLAVEAAYFDVFDENSLDPDPVSVTSDKERIIWGFEPPTDADTLTVSLDARIEPGVQLKRVSGVVAVLEDGRLVTSVEFRTLVLP